MEHRIYVASRASVPQRAQVWRKYRSDGWPIISTWIDEDGPGQTENVRELWARITDEVTTATGFILSAEPEDFPLKGALVEVGMALAAKVPIVIVVPRVLIEQPSCRPIGSWVNHPLVLTSPTILDALQHLCRTFVAPSLVG